MPRSPADSRRATCGDADAAWASRWPFGALLASVVPTRAEYTRNLDRPSDARSLPYLAALTRASGGDRAIELLYVHRLQSLGRFDAAIDALAPAPAGAEDPTIANLRFDLLLAKARAEADGTAARTSAFAEVSYGSSGGSGRSRRRTRGSARLAAVAAGSGRAALGGRVPVRGRPRFRFRRTGRRSSSSPAGGSGLRETRPEPRIASARRPTRRPTRSKARSDRAPRGRRRRGGGPRRMPRRSWPPPMPRAISTTRRCSRARRRSRPRRGSGQGREGPRPSPRLARTRRRRRRPRAGAARARRRRPARGALADIALLVARHPDDPHWRRVEATVAEWSGDPSLALGDWLWLFGHGADTSAPETSLP